MILKYNVDMQNITICNRLRNLVNQTYKLLPIREEQSDWIKPLQTIMEELVGLYNLMHCGYAEIFLPLFNKMEGLYSLTTEEDFAIYRRTIFECLGLLNDLQNVIRITE